MVIKIMGGGCANCKKLYEETTKAVQELGIAAEIKKLLQA